MNRSYPLHGWVGLGLVTVFWPLNWFLSGPRSHWAFFFLWLGYSLAVDALVFKRTGTSLLFRDWRKYIGLFVASTPAWWLFELLNLRVGNWIYQGVDFLSTLAYTLLSTLSFSTVIPAVFATAELFTSLPWFKKSQSGPVIKPDNRTTIAYFVLGWLMLILLLAWPKVFFPFMWTAVYFILAPANVWLGHRTLTNYTQTGEWRPILALWAGVLVTGFFWEFWNYWSYPKWIYQLPYLDVLHLFEMPLLGYLGYLPFSLELFALYHFFAGLLSRIKKSDRDLKYIKISQ